jgi:hypothetical protein
VGRNDQEYSTINLNSKILLTKFLYLYLVWYFFQSRVFLCSAIKCKVNVWKLYPSTRKVEENEKGALKSKKEKDVFVVHLKIKFKCS